MKRRQWLEKTLIRGTRTERWGRRLVAVDARLGPEERKADAWMGDTPTPSLDSWHIYASTQLGEVQYIIWGGQGERICDFRGHLGGSEREPRRASHPHRGRQTFGATRGTALAAARAEGCPAELIAFIEDPFE